MISQKPAAIIFSKIAQLIFFYSFFLYAGLFLLDEITNGSIARVFSLTPLVIVVAVSLFLALPFMELQREHNREGVKILSVRTSAMIAAAGTIIVGLSLRHLGPLGYFVALGFGILLFLGIIAFSDPNGTDQESA